MTNVFGISFPLQLSVGSPGINAEVVFLVVQGRLVLGQVFVEFSGATEFLSSIALMNEDSLARFPMDIGIITHRLSFEVTSTAAVGDLRDDVDRGIKLTGLVQSVGVFKSSFLLQRITSVFKNSQAVVVAVEFHQSHHLGMLSLDVRLGFRQCGISGLEEFIVIVDGGALEQ